MKAPVEVQFAQKLAANDPVERSKAVKKLKKWFASRAQDFEDVEMMRLWKGLYYCFWHSDKPMVQEELAENISSFIPAFRSEKSSLIFIRSFHKTIGREWFGIDRWRKDKFMMLSRRFLRGVFKFLATKEWNIETVNSVVETFSKDVILCPVADTSLAFQLHFTDIFLEEFAKVSGENLEYKILDKLLEPFVAVLRGCEEMRLRDHVEERIFNHLLRQSDPGIQWQEQEDHNGIVNGNDDCSDGEENGSDTNDDGSNSDGEDMNMEENGPQDPRAGRIDVVIPQLQVEYSKLSEDLFEMGSGEGVKKANRDILYRLSKRFKDVASDVFPLGPNLSDEEIEIPKININKSAKELQKANAKLLANNKKEKLVSKKDKLDKISKVTENGTSAANNGITEHTESEEIVDEGKESNNEESDIQSSSKLSSKDLKKKRKREQKKRKRERLAQLEAQKIEKDEKSRQMVEQDLDMKVNIEVAAEKSRTIILATEDKPETLNKVNEEPAVDEIEVLTDEQPPRKKKKKSKTMQYDDQADEFRNKSKKICEESGLGMIDESNLVGNLVEKEPAVEKIVDSVNEDNPLTKKKKKKKDKIEKNAVVLEKPTPDNIEIPAQDEEHLKKKKKLKKLKRTATEAELNQDPKVVLKPDEEHTSDVTETEEKGVENDVGIFKPPAPAKIKKKKLKKEKKIYRIDSDIAFNAPSLSQTNLAEGILQKENHVAEEKPINVVNEKVTEVKLIDNSDPVPTKKIKKMKKYRAETSLVGGEGGNTTVTDDSSLVSVGAKPKSTKLFEEDNSWGDLLPGESEIVMTNKNYKGSVKLAGPAVAEVENALPGFPSPVLTPVKSFTSTFLKKAMSKSQSVESKKSKKKTVDTNVVKHCLSEPRKKRVNVMETKNKSQDITQFIRSVKNSPQTPHDPSKNPRKSALKKSPGQPQTPTQPSNPVQLNTQLNGRSKASKHLKRKSALDFF